MSFKLGWVPIHCGIECGVWSGRADQHKLPFIQILSVPFHFNIVAPSMINPCSLQTPDPLVLRL